MPQSEAQKAAKRRYNASGKRAQVVITMRTADKDNWDAYARARGVPLASLLRRLMADEMARTGWPSGGPDSPGAAASDLRHCDGVDK